MNYNYIILGYSGNLYKNVFEGANKTNYSMYLSGLSREGIFTTLEKIYINEKVNSIVRLPFQKIWVEKKIKNLKKLYEQRGLLEDKTCFILSSRYASYEEAGFYLALRKYFNNPKIVYYFCDLVKIDARKQKLIRQIETQKFDKIFTYDPNDAEKYGFELINAPYSYSPEKTDSSKPDFDVYFIGKAKDRFQTILSLFSSLTESGLKCYFYIRDNKEEILKNKESVMIISRKSISYEENIHNVINSNSILEITQEGANGSSLRVSESIVFNKILITNNIQLRYNPLYNPDHMCFIENDSTCSIDPSFIRKKGFTTNKYLLSIEAFINRIEENL